MDTNRSLRVLGHLKGAKAHMQVGAPAFVDMHDGEERLALVDGILYKYTRQQGMLFRVAYTRIR